MINKIKYFVYSILAKLFGNKWIIKYYRDLGMEIGDKTHVFTKIITSEPYLISIGKSCTIATNVSFLTHDASIGAIGDRERASDLCGRITIGDNCFIGDKSILLYGITISNEVIVAAGSVVTKSISQPGVIVAGNPARIIGYTDAFKEKYVANFFSLQGMNGEMRKKEILGHLEKLISK